MVKVSQAVGYSILGLNDITQLLVMGFIAFALPVTFLRDANISIDFVAGAMSRPMRQTLLALVGILNTAFVAALAWFAWVQAVAELHTPSPTLAIPMMYYWVPLLVGISLSALACALLAVRSFSALMHGR